MGWGPEHMWIYACLQWTVWTIPLMGETEWGDLDDGDSTYDHKMVFLFLWKNDRKKLHLFTVKNLEILSLL